MDSAQSGRAGDRCESCERPRPAPLAQHHRQQYALQREDRADRQVDAARDDHNAQPDGEDAVDADEPRHILQVGRAQEARVQQGYHRTQESEQNENPQLFPHSSTTPPEAALLPTHRLMTASSES